MTRQKWTSKEQAAWLEERKPAFLAANQKRAAAKEFFPVVFKEFRERWPVPPMTEVEVKDAGSVAMAERVKRERYDKRTAAWFHNNSRCVTADAGARGILKISKPAQPRKLQPWQVYHLWTYQTQWKPHVDKAWMEYKKAWEAEHGDKPLGKGRFEIMAEFMRRKYKEEPDEVKKKCEEYRNVVAQQKESRSPSSSKDTLNEAYQSAIDMLPRTLTSISDSIMRQTGWHVTILVGGPSPRDKGALITYLSHTGNTKSGANYREFLGTKGYDEHMLVPFEKFLYESFSPEDQAARSLDKEVSNTNGANENEYPDGKEDQDIEMSDDEWKREQEAKDGGEEQDDGEEDSRAKKGNRSMVSGPSDYEQRRAQNISQLKEMMSALNDAFPMPNLLTEHQAPPSSKKEKGGKGGKKAEGESQSANERRRSSRNAKENDALTDSPHGTTPATEPQQNTLPAQSETTGSGAPSLSITAAPVISLSESGIRALEIRDNHAHNNLNNATSAPEPTVSSPTQLVYPAVTSISSILLNTLQSSPLSSKKTIVNTEDKGSNHNQPPNPPNPPVAIAATASESQPADNHVNIDTAVPNISPNLLAMTPSNIHAPSASPSPSVVKHDTPKPEEVDLALLPDWLKAIMKHLRDSAEDSAWQSLITQFAKYELHDHPRGNLPTKFRPKEVSDWIKSKTKDAVPFLDCQDYGDRFIAWWRAMQPAWRLDNASPGVPRLRDAPEHETWQTLRKKGTAGMYVVVMGLSWWVRAQQDQYSVDAWSAVDDVAWILQQMTAASASGTPPTPEKRCIDNEVESEGRPRKSRRVSA